MSKEPPRVNVRRFCFRSWQLFAIFTVESSERHNEKSDTGGHAGRSSNNRKIEELERSGATVIRCDLGQCVAERVVQAGIAPDMAFTSAAEPDDRLCFFHRSTGTADIYFVYNHSGRAFDSPITLRTPCRNVEAWNPLTAERTPAEAAAGTLQLKLEPYQSMFLIARKM
ncbi:MAG: hypothetical protein J1D86_05700 [Alistipes sp.]|nr:hypothetical protein [Alistipes sp.]